MPRSSSFPAALGGPRKAAVFVLALEESAATEILRLLSDQEVEALMDEIAKLGVIDQETVETVLEEFRDLSGLHGAIREGGVDQALRLVERSFPADRARHLSHLLESHRPNLPFAFLSQADTDRLLAVLEGESAQTIAVVLAHMAPSKAWEVLERFSEERRSDLVRRIAHLEGTHEEVIRRLESSLRRTLGPGSEAASRTRRDGVEAVADIVKASGRGRDELLGVLREGAPDLVDRVSRRLLSFDDVAQLDDETLRTLAESTRPREWALALKTSSRSLRERIQEVLDGTELRDEIEALGPVKLSEIDSARRAILDRASSLQGVTAREDDDRNALTEGLHATDE